MSDLKHTLRAEARKHRSWINLMENDPEGAVPFFLESIAPQPGQVVAGYWPVGREIDCIPVLDAVIKQGITCALPVVKKDTLELGFARWDKSIELVEGAFGIPVPDVPEWLEPDIVIVPMLAFDRRGTRLGQGGGYYDATLAALRARKDITAVGLAYAQQAVLFNLPVEEHDQALDWVITPQGTHYFGD